MTPSTEIAASKLAAGSASAVPSMTAARTRPGAVGASLARSRMRATICCAASMASTSAPRGGGDQRSSAAAGADIDQPVAGLEIEMIERATGERVGQRLDHELIHGNVMIPAMKVVGRVAGRPLVS